MQHFSTGLCCLFCALYHVLLELAAAGTMTKHCVQHVAVVGGCLQVVLACVIIPLWLLVVRQLVRQQQPIHAAVAAVAGMVLLLIAEAVHSSAAAGDQAASWAVATPASISAMMGKEVGSEVHRALLSTCIHQQL
jgi:hypothetical protein